MPITKDNAHQFLPLVQALAEGKTVQAKNHDGEWQDMVGGLSFVNEPEDYRIKPAPRRFTVMVPKNPPPGDNITNAAWAVAENVSDKDWGPDWEAVEVVEVIK